MSENTTSETDESTATEETPTEASGASTEEQATTEETPAAKPTTAERYARSMQQEVIDAPEINIESLLKAGAHFGHQAHRWNPKMTPYLFGEKNGIHIINLDITLELWKKAAKFLEDTANKGGSILMVGTKSQAREIVETMAAACGGFSVTQRWLGGTLSNFETIKQSISRMRKLEELLEKVQQPDNNIKLNKKERLGLTRELEKLNGNLGGIRNMRHVPDVLFVVDVRREAIAVREARKLHIPVVALVDSNVDPSDIDYPIPSNDDASKSIRLFVENVAAAISRGRSAFLSRGPEAKEATRKASGDAEGLEVVTKGKGAQKEENEGKSEATSAAAAV